MSPSRQLLVASGAIAAIAIFGVSLALREHSHRHRRPPVEGLPSEDDTAPLRGTDWNGPVTPPNGVDNPLPVATDPASSSSAFHMPTPNDPVPPMSAIPAPTIAPPLDPGMESGQKARAIEMMQQHVALLEKEAAAADKNGDADGAAAIRVRIERLKGRISTEQDGGT